MTTGEKLKHFIKQQGHTQSSFAEETGESYSNLNKMCNGERDINYTFISRLTNRYPDIDLNELLKDDAEIITMINDGGEIYRKTPSKGEILDNMIKEIELLRHNIGT